MGRMGCGKERKGEKETIGKGRMIRKKEGGGDGSMKTWKKRGSKMCSQEKGREALIGSNVGLKAGNRKMEEKELKGMCTQKKTRVREGNRGLGSG